MMEGVNLNEYKKDFGDQEAARVFQEMQPFIKKGWILWDGAAATLSNEGKLMADGIASELFF